MSHRLLIVDDKEAILFALSQYFSLRGFEVDCARQKEEAVALLGQKQYAAVIADLRLTGSESVEGLEVADAVRQRWLSTVVILLTAYGSPRIEAEARAHGVDVLLHKPHPLPDVARIVLDLIDARQCDESRE
jgi:DNA-binding response OmpR family regulator